MSYRVPLTVEFHDKSEFEEFVSFAKEDGRNVSEILADSVRLWVYVQKPHTSLVVRVCDSGRLIPVIQECEPEVA